MTERLEHGGPVRTFEELMAAASMVAEPPPRCRWRRPHRFQRDPSMPFRYECGRCEAVVYVRGG